MRKNIASPCWDHGEPIASLGRYNWAWWTNKLTLYIRYALQLCGIIFSLWGLKTQPRCLIPIWTTICSLDSLPYWLIQDVALKGLNLRVMDASLCKGILLSALKESGLHTLLKIFAFGWRGRVLKSVVADSSRCSWKIPFSWSLSVSDQIRF